MAHRGRLSTREFGQVFEQGETASHKWFTLRVLSAPECARVRWGIAVGKRMAPSSVDRNRLKRRLRAAVDAVPPVSDAWVVVQLKARGADAHVSELSRAIEARLSTMGLSRCSGQ